MPKEKIDVYDVGKIYDYGAFRISPFELCHNVPQCGYKVFIGDEKAIYATDTENLDMVDAKGFDLFMIEANYQDDELQERINAKIGTGEYCYELNVANRHLSKDQADSFLLENMGENSQYVYLHGHKDREQNENEVNTDDKN